MVITPVLLLQCIMHNRLTKHRRGQGQIAFHRPLDACWEMLTRSLVKDLRRWLTCTGSIWHRWVTTDVSRWRPGGYFVAPCCLFFCKDWCRSSPLLQYFEVRPSLLSCVKMKMTARSVGSYKSFRFNLWL